MDWQALTPLTRWQKAGTVAFFVMLLVYGGLVEARSALMERRMGDLDVFLRAAWAVRNNADPYAITSDNGWHYIYPPLYAILLTPLADPPLDADRAGYLPYAVCVGICYLLNLLCLMAGVHSLASALQDHAEDPAYRTQPTYCKRWWVLRLWPVFVCVLPIGHTLMRGQVNAIVLAILCTAIAGWMRGQNYRAGLWLALAICLKVIPAYLLVYPLWKRDWRGLAGCAAGCLVGLGLIPLLAFGPTRATEHYATYGRVFFGPLLKVSDDDSRKEEILGVNATDSVGVKNALHNWMFPDAAHRPEDMGMVAKGLYLALGIGMTLLTLLPRSDSGAGSAHVLGGLVVLMAIFSPVCHSHYLLFCLPAVMSLMAHTWQYQPTVRVPWPMAACFVAFVAVMAIAYLPGLEILKDRCASLFATLPLWGVPAFQLWRETQMPPLPMALRRAA
ncbi:MAG TPA: glycosyltransferase family 87 protein [Gemmataceae bacterium]|nr:glycosyltransferase family 87 protein [Gemmataceae bacterium]